MGDSKVSGVLASRGVGSIVHVSGEIAGELKYWVVVGRELVPGLVGLFQ